ncbi:ABC transporter permease subunit [Erwinia aphidicola]|jgi:putative spermidine/putrescine transport system permease protein|uniref:ABC transporter permease subunit n=1 Tax=Erwinia aphidicola TaxID=68334 RepID=A0ABU8DKD9_ERWAP|nr:MULTISPECIES: ABC transporter permease subunit [Erwinia]KMV68534.1 ABC transporter permease [bacteria symbiont BFo1 of Frankliniella occidentalis]KYP83379.1 ABC transporter permease [bacteria symbiont BFo1 of Frankliniella occidentalis]KYP88138.1 ABC transporter permease [bacteria symbiont BFo1 of Frankliniella occidentalis]MBD1375450.1 ABC transporter permease subunit [Erwinia aphidicola]MBN1084358.1 ABC transporter permease subunit [Erwinia aphidicola]
MRGKWLALLCLLPFALFFIAFQIAPLVWIAINSFYSDINEAWGWANYSDILTSPFYQQAIRFSLNISFWSSVYGLAIALFGGYSLHQLGGGRLHRFLMSFTNMTSNFAGVPLAFAFVILLGLNGCLTLLMGKYDIMQGFKLYSSDGLIVVYTWFQIPLGILLLYPAFDSLKRDWQESAALLGASRARYWWHIGLPILMPALIGTFVILLANALGAYATIYALTTGNFNVIPVRIAALVSGDISLDPNLGSALAMLLVVLMSLITVIHQWLVRKSYQHVRQGS